MPRNGPSGTYSKDWMSRADQSLRRTTPKTWSAKARPCGGLAELRPDAYDEADLGLQIELSQGPNSTAPEATRRKPLGRLTSVPETTTVPARP